MYCLITDERPSSLPKHTIVAIVATMSAVWQLPVCDGSGRNGTALPHYW